MKINIEDYQTDLLEYGVLKQRIAILDVTTIRNVGDVYHFLDQLNDILFRITVYDKYYNIKKNIDNTIVMDTYISHIIKLYKDYNDLYYRFVSQVVRKFDYDSFRNCSYHSSIQKIYQLSRHIPKEQEEYNKYYMESEQIYNRIYREKVSDSEKLEMILRYVFCKERMAQLKNYKSFLAERLDEIGLTEEVFYTILHYPVSIKNVEIKLDTKYSISDSLCIIKNIGSQYLDLDVLEYVTGAIFYRKFSNHSCVLSCYKKQPFLFVGYKHNLQGMDRLFHEISHAYHYVKASDCDLTNYNPNQFISEMFAMTNELVLLSKMNCTESRSLIHYNYNHFLFDAIKSLRLEDYIHKNYDHLTVSDIEKFDENYMDHLNFLFNDYYDINYALGMVLASLLSDQIYHHIFTRQDINLLLQSDGNRTAKEILENVGIDINDSTMISQLLDKIVSF